MNSSEEKTLLETMVAFRRSLHQHPELSWHESRTAAVIGDVLRQWGISFRQVAQMGIVADIDARGAGPRVALRADMDGLPIREETNLEFASLSDGIMHACGHDGHVSMLLGAAHLLARDADLPAPVRLIFQPAEEVGEGARAMIEAGALDNVAMIFGGHLDQHYPTGTIVVSDGVVNASTDEFDILITGQGSHAARPHESIDAVVVGSLMVMAFQTIVSREMNPAHPSVVSVGRFDAGTAANVIAGQARLQGTIRCHDPGVRAHLRKSMHRIATAVGNLHGAKVHVGLVEGTPAVINTPEATELAREAATEVVGQEHLLKMETANMGGEDFSRYLEKVPGCYVRFGAQLPVSESYPAHSSRFDFDEKAMVFGANYLRAVARIAGEHIRLVSRR